LNDATGWAVVQDRGQSAQRDGWVDLLDAFGNRLGHRFGDTSLLDRALSHRSWCAEQPRTESNERLEYLGDAVLGLVVAQHCYVAYPDFAEGRLAKVRSSVVNARVLAEVAEELGVGPVLRLGKGEEASGGREKGSLLADALEALIGAVYVDAGWDAASALVMRMLGERIDRAAVEPNDFDHKSRLQEETVRRGDGVPRYVVEGWGPDHGRRYRAEVYIGGAVRGTGEGSSKKDAEQQAAAAAWQQLDDA
jgi:ribonuclease III